MNIAIIGAGPIGSYTASLLARSGHQVHLFDQKTQKNIGRPIQCTGIFPPEIRKYVPLHKDFHTNTTQHLQIISPFNHQITLHKTEYIFNRTKFDQHLLQQAIQNGTHFHPQHQLLEINHNTHHQHNLIFKHKNTRKIFSPDIIIGADGPLSLVYQYLNPKKKKSFYYGLQATIKGQFQPDTYQTFFHNQISPHSFAWLVPESKTRARLGLAVKNHPSEHFQQLLQHLNITDSQLLQKQAGIIPLFNPKIIFHKNNLFLLGDAASHIKNTTFGGITPALQQARHLVNIINQRKPYQPQLKSLQHHHQIRQILNRFTNQDYHCLIKLLNKPQNKHLLQTHSRENPQKLLIKLALKNPSLLKFIKYLF